MKRGTRLAVGVILRGYLEQCGERLLVFVDCWPYLLGNLGPCELMCEAMRHVTYVLVDEEDGYVLPLSLLLEGRLDGRYLCILERFQWVLHCKIDTRTGVDD